jgi:hypothetical protein
VDDDVGLDEDDDEEALQLMTLRLLSDHSDRYVSASSVQTVYQLLQVMMALHPIRFWSVGLEAEATFVLLQIHTAHDIDFQCFLDMMQQVRSSRVGSYDKASWAHLPCQVGEEMKLMSLDNEIYDEVVPVAVIRCDHKSLVVCSDEACRLFV